MKIVFICLILNAFIISADTINPRNVVRLTNSVTPTQQKRNPMSTTFNDTLREIILDSTYVGSDADLKVDVDEGKVSRYIVRSGQKFYERIRLIQTTNEGSFLVENWVLISICAFIIGGFSYFKYIKPKQEESEIVDDNENNE